MQQTDQQASKSLARNGLSAAEVSQRVADGLTNDAKEPSSRTLGDILRANVFTLFNLILGIALVAILLTGSWPDAVFGFVLLINAGTGVLAELRAKKILDELAVLDAPIARVVRDGVETEIPIKEVVQDDLLHVLAGDQIPADAVVVQSNGLELDESILTGESVPVRKSSEDDLLSGSVVVAGDGYALATKVGAAAYAHQIAGQVKRFSLAKSELRTGIDKILKVISWIIAPVAILLAWAQVRAVGSLGLVLATDGGWQKMVVSAVAGVVGMVPQGLVLLTSVNFAVAAVVLARQQVLVQELPAVEVLARVDVICLDKTGTLTTGKVDFDHFVPVDADQAELAQAAALLTSVGEQNATGSAIQAALDEATKTTLPKPVSAVPFSSQRKWSAVNTASQALILGAPELLFTDPEIRQQAADIAANGSRVLAIASANQQIDPEDPLLPAELTLLGLVVLSEQLRDDARDTLAWFSQEDVQVKIISGDNPATVAALARRVGLEVTAAMDARELPDPELNPKEFAELVANTTVFGRVTPEQKRAIVEALQSMGHTVAMTGDGVNDALALKRADLGIAMGNGARATKAAAKLVLLDGRFATLPSVMAEGRRVIANMERVSSLFLNKTSYATILAIVISLAGWSYIFMPRHLTLLGIFTIGVPAFCLALPPNSQRYRPGFLARTLSLAIPAGTIGAIAVLVVLIINGSGTAASSTMATLVLALTSVTLLALISKPLLGWRGGLLAAMIAGLVAVIFIAPLRHFFALTTLTAQQSLQVAIIGGTASCLVVLAGWLAKKYLAK